MIDLNSPGTMFFVYIALFVGALLIFEGLRQLVSREEDGTQARNRRMKMMQKGATAEDVLSLFLDEQDTQSTGLFGIPNFTRLLRQAGIQMSMARLCTLLAVIGVIAFFVALKFFTLEISAGIAVFAGLLLPWAIISHIRGKRIEALTAQLPDALDLMARGLSVGHPISVTVSSVASDMPDPIGTEFGIIQDQVSYGDDIVAAFFDLSSRYDIEDLNYLSVSVGIQHGTGGNLARVLKVLSKVIRDRATMRKKIHAISAEGRLSALILSALPFMIFGVINLSTPSFYGDVQDDALFLPVMATILGLVVLQAVILFRMVNFKF